MLKPTNVLLSCFLLLAMFSITFVYAEQIGQRQDAKINEPYIISQPCATCTYMNISVFTKDGIILNNIAMDNNGSTWTHTFTPNTSLRNDVNGIGDKNGLDDSFAFWFDVTLSGEQTNPSIIVADIVLILLIICLLIFLKIKYKGVDFDKWNESIMDSHDNIGKTITKGLIYGLMKNAFIWYYFIIWLMFFVLKDMVYRFNSVEIYRYLVLIFDIYSFGFFFVMVLLIGFFYKYIKDTVNDLLSDSWGVEHGK
jgi:hypothetical protein